jgi:hypothetical protein
MVDQIEVKNVKEFVNTFPLFIEWTWDFLQFFSMYVHIVRMGGFNYSPKVNSEGVDGVGK